MAPAEDNTVRLRLGYPDVETFVERFAPNVTAGGVFISSKSPRPVGEVLRFEISLAGGPLLLSGEGQVAWIRAFDPNEARKPHGMSLQFIKVDEGTSDILDRLVQAGEGARARRRSSLPAGRSTPARGTQTLKYQSPEGFDEFSDGLSEARISRAYEYALALGTASEKNLGHEISADDDEPVTLDKALDGLSSFLRPRSKSGMYRIPAELLPAAGDRKAK